MDAASIEVFCYLVQVVADVMVLGCQFLRFWNIHPEVIGYDNLPFQKLLPDVIRT